MLLVASDAVLLLVAIIGYQVIQFMQKDFAKQFDSQRVSARDFTVKIERLPDSFKQYKDELSLKHAICKMITNKVERCKQEQQCPADLDPAIVDINFCMSDIGVLEKQR